jgi:hypothetical protein
MENQELDTEFAAFMEAFDDSLSNQTEADSEGEQEGQQESDRIDAQQPDGDDDGSEKTPAQQEDVADGIENPAEQAEETFTLKINKEERTCTREEVISLAQKGADYDRVKEKLTQQQRTLDLLSEYAKESGMEIPALLDDLWKGLWKKQGLSDDAVTERLERQKLERENAALKAQKGPEPDTKEAPKEKAQRELAEFKKAFPEVPLTDALYEKLKQDIVHGGFSMTEAYRRMKDREQSDRIKELEAQLAAKKQNESNKAGSPGSQKDVGGRGRKSEFDDFMRALE